MTSEVDDIEDIISGSHNTDIRSGNKQHVVPKTRRFKNKEAGQEASGDSIIPGTNTTMLNYLRMFIVVEDFFRKAHLKMFFRHKAVTSNVLHNLSDRNCGN